MINENNKDDVNNNLNENKIEEEIKIINDQEIEKIFQLYINDNKEKNEENIYNKKDFEFLIEIMNKLNDEEFIIFINYLNYINKKIIELLINNYIELDFDNEKLENIIINIISKTMNIYCNKDIFYYIYKKLSIFYRSNNNINLKNFEKLFKIWKILYNIESYFKNIENNNNLFFSCIDNNTNYITINFGEKIRNCKKGGTDSYFITIDFIPSSLLDINKSIVNFSFIILYDDKEDNFEINSKHIFIDDNKIKSFSKINSIRIELRFNSYKIHINNDITIDKKNIDFNFNYIRKLKLLNNFYGEISSIKIGKGYDLLSENINPEDLMTLLQQKLIIDIKKNDNQVDLNVELDGKSVDIDNNLMQFSGEIFSNKYYDKIIKKNYNIDLKNIGYYGGFDCFIPIFKIINYIICQSKPNNNINDINEENEENKKNEIINDNEVKVSINNNLLKSIIWIKDILKIILKMICLSEDNYNNFLTIIVSLIGSIAEILETLKTFPNNYITLLLKDEIFFIFYIIILNSSLPNNIKIIYKDLFKIDEYFIDFDFKMESLIFDLNNINNLKWYSLFLLNFIEFLILYFKSAKLIPDNLVNHLIKIYGSLIDNKKVSVLFIQFVKAFCLEGETDINELFGISHNELMNDEFYLNHLISMIKTYLNAFNSSKNPGFELNTINYAKIQQLFLNYIFNQQNSKNSNHYNDKNVEFIISNFKDYINNIKFIYEIFPFLKKKEDKFISENLLTMNELIDYHGQYHHTMKELFIFNRIWSDQTLFFKDSLQEIKNSKIKYKIINYYTRNFQRPILYPYLDYKKHYPEFSKFEIKEENEFYKDHLENKDNYNFDIECTDKLDKLLEKYDKEKIKEIEKNGVINLFENICLVKRGYHVKGNLFIAKDQKQKKIIIYFYSFPYSSQLKQQTCNKQINQNEKSNLCYGAIFKCPKKEGNRKILIDFDDIRLMIKRIYFYRKSAIEIFTETKSYYFNFFEENRTEDFFNMFSIPYKHIYYPIYVKENFIGIIKVNHKIIEKEDYLKLVSNKKSFLEYISNKTSKGNLFEMCIFDLIILINLLSNRSFNDLHQYPIFPVLYFYDKKNDSVKDRKINTHIGLFNELDCSKKRSALFQEIYDAYLNEYHQNHSEEIPHFFSTHYSNIVYTSNFLIRLFPFSFLAIELQGDGFDDPNRLFYSIEETLYNISFQKSDLRELIPEFFYLPEMFMNINCINFHKRSNNQLVDDVNIEKINFINDKKKNKNKNNNYEKVINSEILGKTNDTEIYFNYINNMKKKLESTNNIINGWINLIFGIYQKYNNKNELYFRIESYIDKEDNDYNKFLKDDIIMSSVEFGLIPLQTIFEKKLFNNLKDNYEKIDSEIKNELKKDLNNRKKLTKNKNEINTINNNEMNIINQEKTKNNIIQYTNDLNKINKNYFNNEFKDYWEEPLEIEFKIKNNGNIGMLGVYKNGNLINEIADHSNKIIDFFYNRRLNMFATTSYDGFICIYILPNKLISMIKHPENSYFDQIMLSSNPFPSIIAFDKKKNNLISYSLSGIMIKNIILNNDKKIEIKIEPVFNVYGGTFKDRINICYTQGDIQMLSVPFFELK